MEEILAAREPVDIGDVEVEARRSIEAEILRSRPDLRAADVVFTDNTSTMVSRAEHDGCSTFRIHRIFRTAPQELLGEIVRSFYVKMRRREVIAIRARLKDYVESRREEIPRRPFSLDRTLPPAGTCFDLEEILTRVAARHVPEVGPVQIAWSRQILKRLMGKWIENPPPLPNLVLINRLLDTPEVPEYYLEFLVFHELLHEAMPIHRSSGRWVRHPPEFRTREREHPDFRRARKWEAENIARLYRRHKRRHARTAVRPDR